MALGSRGTPLACRLLWGGGPAPPPAVWTSLATTCPWLSIGVLSQNYFAKLLLLSPGEPHLSPESMCMLRVFLLVGRGGIEDGDIIVKVNGRPLVDSSELQEAVLNESPLLLEVRRGNDDLLFSITPEVVM